jgi:hypothetical protein
MEMIHRGTQYMRAIQHYYKKFGRYPMRIEDLENTNNMRFIRRRYKDPITGKEFRLLHFGEVQMGGIGGLAGGAGMMGGAATAAMSGAFGQGSAANSSMFAQQAGSLGARGGLGSFGSTGMASGQPGATSGQTDALAGKVFGGGPIIGVASTSHAASIREFNKKSHYNDWYFIYDPSFDRGGLLKGPAVPPLAGAGGSVVGNPAAGPNPSLGPGGMNSPAMNSPFGNPSLQGPGAMIPAQPQQAQPQQ